MGSGIAGLSLAAWLLAHGDDDVVVLERHHAASGATGRNAGFILADSEATGLAARLHGRATALALRDAGLATRAFVRSLDAPGTSFPGSLRLASDRGEAAAFAETVDLLGAAAVGAAPRGRPLPLRDVHLVAPPQPEGGPLPWRAALVDDGDGLVDPLLLVASLLRMIQVIPRFDDTAVVELLERRIGVELYTRDAVIQADRVIVCTNADTRRLVPAALPRVRPVRAQALAAWVDPAPPWVRPTYATRGGDYWRPLPDGRVLLGGLRRLARRAENTGDAVANPAVQRELDRFLRRLVGREAHIEVTQRWAGTMGFTPDGVPVVGRAPRSRRVHVLAGCNGHGMGWAPGLAAALAAQLQGAGPPLPKCMRPGR